MWSDSNKLSNDTNIDVLKNTLNITHLKQIADSKFEVSNCEEVLKELKFYINNYFKGISKDFKHTILNFILITKFLLKSRK